MASVDLRDEVTCSICMEIYTDPVTLTCGHSFCQLCITKTWDNQEEGEYSCPECLHRFRVKPELKRNLRLSNIAENIRSTHLEREVTGIPCTYCIQSPVPAVKTCLLCEASLCEDHLRVHCKSAAHVLTEPTTSLESRKCTVHKKVLEYYCCEDATCICVSCRLDGEHRGHQVETLNEASEKKKKEKVRNILQKLTSQREETEKRVQSLEELRRQVRGKAAGVTERVTALIRDIRKQLEALEKQVLSEISRQEKQVSLRVSDLIRQLKIKKEKLSRKMGDIEELCDMTDPLTVLQEKESDRADYCDAETHDIKVHDVRDLDVEQISKTLHSGLAGIVNEIKRRHKVREVSDMSLGLNTASDTLLDVSTVTGVRQVHFINGAGPDTSKDCPNTSLFRKGKILLCRHTSAHTGLNL
uniref:E3 ubiquitin/ISG15 ligase TRIM25-like n=1 Tax=Leptobrachium leishanense TaxID=445787 RepID=A0A8C5Q4Z6_9ANUR